VEGVSAQHLPVVNHYRLLFRSILRLLCFALGVLTLEALARLHDGFA